MPAARPRSPDPPPVGAFAFPEVNPMGYDDLATTLWTAREAAREAQVTATTIRSWVRRGHLEAAATDEHGWPLYRALDVIKAEKATRERAHRRYLVVAA